MFLRPTLEKLSNSNKTCVFAGDFNVDLLNYGDNSRSDEFFDEVSGFSFRPLVLQPSRINNRSFTLIDNIFINDSTCSSSGGNITSSISDHLSQFSFINIIQNGRKAPQIIYSRDWKNFNKQMFAYELSKYTWTNVTSPDIDTNSSTKNFFDNVNKLLDEMAPVKKLTRKEKGLLNVHGSWYFGLYAD